MSRRYDRFSITGASSFRFALLEQSLRFVRTIDASVELTKVVQSVLNQQWVLEFSRQFQRSYVQRLGFVVSAYFLKRSTELVEGTAVFLSPPAFLRYSDRLSQSFQCG